MGIIVEMRRQQGDGQIRAQRLELACQLHTVQRARHSDVGNDAIERMARLEQRQGFRGIHCLKHIEPGISQPLGGGEANKHVVLDHKNHGLAGVSWSSDDHPIDHDTISRRFETSLPLKTVVNETRCCSPTPFIDYSLRNRNELHLRPLPRAIASGIALAMDRPKADRKPRDRAADARDFKRKRNSLAFNDPSHPDADFRTILAVSDSFPTQIRIFDLRAFLVGNWRVERVMQDFRNSISGTMSGTASFTVNDKGLDYEERGSLRFGSHQGLATQSYHYVFEEGGRRATVRFRDGRHFYDLDLSEGQAAAAHLCPPDRYEGVITALGRDRWVSRWTIAGPRKRQEILTGYFRHR